MVLTPAEGPVGGGREMEGVEGEGEATPVEGGPLWEGPEMLPPAERGPVGMEEGPVGVGMVGEEVCRGGRWEGWLLFLETELGGPQEEEGLMPRPPPPMLLRGVKLPLGEGAM